MLFLGRTIYRHVVLILLSIIAWKVAGETLPPTWFIFLVSLVANTTTILEHPEWRKP